MRRRQSARFMAPPRGAKAHGALPVSMRQLCLPGPQQRRQIVGKMVLRTRNTGAGDKVKKAGGAHRNICKPLVGRSGSPKENGVEVMSPKNSPVIVRFFRRQVGSENPIRSNGFCSSGKFFKTHLQDGIVIAE